MAAKQAAPKRLTRDAWSQWIGGLDAFLFDCDGGASRSRAAAQASQVLTARGHAQCCGSATSRSRARRSS